MLKIILVGFHRRTLRESPDSVVVVSARFSDINHFHSTLAEKNRWNGCQIFFNPRKQFKFVVFSGSV